MTVQTQYRVPAIDGVRTGTSSSHRRPVVLGLVLTLALLAAVVVVGRVAATRTSTAPASVTPVTGELNAKALADRGATATMGARSGELNAKALADRGATAGITVRTGEPNAKALADRGATAAMATGGVQSGYSDRDAVEQHLRSTGSSNAPPGVVLRRHARGIPILPTTP